MHCRRKMATFCSVIPAIGYGRSELEVVKTGGARLSGDSRTEGTGELSRLVKEEALGADFPASGYQEAISFPQQVIKDTDMRRCLKASESPPDGLQCVPMEMFPSTRLILPHTSSKNSEELHFATHRATRRMCCVFMCG